VGGAARQNRRAQAITTDLALERFEHGKQAAITSGPMPSPGKTAIASSVVTSGRRRAVLAQPSVHRR
jgi:hypothetical protein